MALICSDYLDDPDNPQKPIEDRLRDAAERAHSSDSPLIHTATFDFCHPLSIYIYLASARQPVGALSRKAFMEKCPSRQKAVHGSFF